jgi:hypothetical protein
MRTHSVAHARTHVYTHITHVRMAQLQHRCVLFSLCFLLPALPSSFPHGCVCPPPPPPPHTHTHPTRLCTLTDRTTIVSALLFQVEEEPQPTEADVVEALVSASGVYRPPGARSGGAGSGGPSQDWKWVSNPKSSYLCTSCWLKFDLSLQSCCR